MGIAHELITRGWYQGGLVGPDESVCLVGAAQCAAFGDIRYGTNLEDYAQGRQICALVGAGVGFWNDAPERTFDEVLRVAKEADELLGL